MEIVYINPGYTTGLTGTGLTYVESEEYNPINGVAFTASSFCYCIMSFPTHLLEYPNITDANKHYIKCVSVKFSVYCEGLNGTGGTASGAAPFSTGIRVASNNYGYGSSPSTLPNVRFFEDKYIVKAGSSEETINFSSEGFRNIALSIHSDNNNVSRFGTCDVDGRVSTFTIPQIQSNNPYGVGLIFNFSNSQYGKAYVSNIVVATSTEVSDTSPTESSLKQILSSDTTLIKLPLSTPTGTFSAEGDGKYVGTASGQQLLQTIDATDLITKFGGDTKVNNLIVYGNPGYKTGNGITTAYGISGDDDGDAHFTTHGSCTLSADPNAIASVSWDETENDTTIFDLDGWEVGWKI